MKFQECFVALYAKSPNEVCSVSVFSKDLDVGNIANGKNKAIFYGILDSRSYRGTLNRIKGI